MRSFNSERDIALKVDFDDRCRTVLT